MQIDKNKIEEIASLARIKLTNEEKEKYIAQFADILGYFQQLEEVDTESISPLINANSQESVMRDDIVEECGKDVVDGILEQVPERKDRYVKVKKVL